MVLLHGKLAVGWVRAKITKAIATINMIKPIVQDVFFLTTTPTFYYSPSCPAGTAFAKAAPLLSRSSPCCVDGGCSLRYSRGFVPHGKLPLFITPLLWFCYAVEARF